MEENWKQQLATDSYGNLFRSISNYRLIFTSDENLSMIKYENNLYAAGIRDGKVEIYESVDGARTWAVPDGKTILPANIGLPTEIKLATGKENTIWLVCAGTGQMWRGYLNRLKTDNN